MSKVTVFSRIAAGILMLLLTIALVPLTGTPADAAPSRSTEEAKAEARFFDLHNRARTDPATFGLGQRESQDKLLWSEDLAEEARDWSDQMAGSGHLSESGLGYAENNSAAHMAGSLEMVVDELMEDWIASDSHRDNILGEDTEVGVGVAIDDWNNIWVTVLFDTPEGPSDATDAYPGSSEVLKARPCSGDAHALAGDWEGDGFNGIGWWCDGETRLWTTSGDVHEFKYGRAGDVPVVADWNGDGRDTVSVIRDGTWHLNNRLRGGVAERTFVYGRVTRGDVPVAGDWDRGGRDLPGIVRDSEWHLRDRQAGGIADWEFIYGRLTRGDLPLWGDWNGDGRDTAGVVREGTWHLRNRHAGGVSDTEFTYGRVTAGDMPVVGDWTGDGRDTPMIVRGGIWHFKYEHGGGPADFTAIFPRP